MVICDLPARFAGTSGLRSGCGIAPESDETQSRWGEATNAHQGAERKKRLPLTELEVGKVKHDRRR